MLYLKAYLIALGVFIALSFGLYIAWQQVVLDPGQLRFYLFVALWAAVVLVAVNVLQVYKNAEDAVSMANHFIKEMLASSRELFFELYRGSPVPYLLIEQSGSITSTNTAAVRLFGVAVNGLDGQNFFSLIKTDDTPHTAIFTEKLMRGVPLNDEEMQIVRKDGEERWVLCSFFSFIDGEDVQRGLVTLVDISKQKQIDQAKTEFVSLASHQLRTPIATMSWNLELLLMKHEAELSAPAQEYISKSMASLRQMNLLVGDFLNASRFELGTLKCEKETVGLHLFIDAVVEEHIKPAEEKGVTIQKNYDSQIVSITSDPRLLQMIVNNLVSNAVKYTPSGGTVSIETHLSGSSVVVIVSDTGMGIPKSEQSRLFSKIFRATNAIASVPDGTGLGLYIANQAAKVLGGDIVCESQEGVGTTFTVTLS